MPTAFNRQGELVVVVRGPKKHKLGREATYGVTKLVAKRHMDPAVRQSWYNEYVMDMQAFNTLPMQYPCFTILFKRVSKDLQVYVRKNKGASMDCRGE